MDPIENVLKTKINNGTKCFGMWLHSASPAVAEIVAHAGLDFVIIDQEHGVGDLDNAIAMMRALLGTDTAPIVRVASSDPTYLKRIVDAGAQSILVPMVDSAEEAKSVVDACLYPPHGKRGNAAGVVRASRYGLVGDYVARAHEQMLIIPQIETAQAVKNASAISSVEGVDVVFIGPSDLSGSIGLPDQTGAPEVEALITEAYAAIRKAGKPAATVPRDGRSWQALFDDGFQLVATGSDLAYIRQAVLAQAKERSEWSRR
ncbi:aldolase/citrate lyase family protein [Neorhizobium sp. NCHU2750]|uniref:HpcH/HpaI aldolase family protein n=1 Tax=Neorhizobium sp. NCHU2750 TaxID=1825976 RepID=UPI000E72866C|nr:4-hydroxy-2-oxoheptanedioate aldolase [Neorhizobium sp. NCHU2750]